MKSAIAARSIEVVIMPDVTATVVVVDDDVSVCESLGLLIRTPGWKPEPLASAQEFLSHLRAAAPCRLVLDATLPGLNALELQPQLAERLRGECEVMTLVVVRASPRLRVGKFQNYSKGRTP